MTFFIPGMDVNKDSSLKAKARTKDWRFKVKDRSKDFFLCPLPAY